MNYKLFIESALLICAEIWMLFELLFAIRLEKGQEIFIVEYKHYLAIFCRVSWILDVYFISYDFFLEAALF